MPKAQHAFDGNYSARRVGNAGSVDEWVFDSDYLQSREYVDRFKDKVKCRPQEPTDEKEVSTVGRDSHAVLSIYFRTTLIQMTHHGLTSRSQEVMLLMVKKCLHPAPKTGRQAVLITGKWPSTYTTSMAFSQLHAAIASLKVSVRLYTVENCEYPLQVVVTHH